jgi:hypothetical protein
MVGANLSSKTVGQFSTGTLIGLTPILVVFFLLPIYSMLVSSELAIHKGLLIIKSFPSKQQKIYDLRNLVWWEAKPATGRYMSGRILYLGFVDQANIQRSLTITEMEFNNFDAILAYFETDFRRLKRELNPDANTIPPTAGFTA